MSGKQVPQHANNCPGNYRSWYWVFADILRNVLTRVGGTLRNGRRRCSCTLTQFVTTLLPITCLISPAPSIVFSSSMAGVAGKKGQGGCHEQYRKGMISSSFPHIAGCLRAGIVGTGSTCSYLLCRRRNSILCRLKRTPAGSSDGLSLTFDTPMGLSHWRPTFQPCIPRFSCWSVFGWSRCSGATRMCRRGLGTRPTETKTKCQSAGNGEHQQSSCIGPGNAGAAATLRGPRLLVKS